MLRVRKSKAIERLQKLVDETSGLDLEVGRSQKTQKWINDVYSAFHYIFGEESYQFSRLPQTHKSTPNGFREYLNAMVSQVASSLDDVTNFGEDDEETELHPIDQSGFTAPEADRNGKGSESNKVFVVHGHDEVARMTVARFLEKLKLEPVILHEQANQGRTIIEKIEHHANADFAVVLLTPDDLGKASKDEGKPQHRARQNVIFELGFFIGRLGRENVCALKGSGVEIPSDYNGVVYTELDERGAWKMELAQELKASGFNIDANQILQS